MPHPSSDELLLARLVDLPAEDRTAFWQRACAEDPSLPSRHPEFARRFSKGVAPITPREAAAAPLSADAMIGALASALGPTNDSAPGVRIGPMADVLKSALGAADHEAPGVRIGHYKLLQKIGEGGFGAVWMAEQLEPIRRRVAMKIVKVGMDTEEVIARFEVERQALALMDHPNIARVFDAGATASGRPYFVMELVRGVSITRYCDDNRLPAENRLRLFVSVCQAVQHAHQKGVIHRDLKPSNILVTVHDGTPVPKVIDFGIAKATDKQLTEKTLVTQFHAFVGTPAYTSPEQMEMSGLDVDTRSDIYSLGVLLYELLAGRPPFDPDALIKSGLEAMRRTIREIDPPRPSSRLGTLNEADRTSVAHARSTDAAKLSLLLRGDVDWIVMHCLEKDRTRRYETANALARDVERHLANEPVSARPPSQYYRVQKYIRRNKVGVAAIAAIAVSLVGGLIASSISYVQERAAHERAVVAERSESKLRQHAEAARAHAEAQAYAADMNLVQQSIEQNNMGRALNLLNSYRPRSGIKGTGNPVAPGSQADLRGWEWRYLWQLCRSDASFSLREGGLQIISVATSHDGQWIAHGSERGGELSVWNLSTRQETQLAAGNAEVLVAFSPTEFLLAFALTTSDESHSAQRMVRLWNGMTQSIVAEIPMTSTCIGLSFSGDGATLVTLTQAGELSFWSVPDGVKQRSHPTPKAYRGLSRGHPFSIANNLAIAAYAKPGTKPNTGIVCVLDLASGEEHQWEQASGSVSALALSPDGELLAVAEFRTIRLFASRSGKLLHEFEGHGNHLLELAFSPDGTRLASASADQTICVWELSDLNSATPSRTFRGHQLEVTCLAFLKDGGRLVSGGKDGALHIWDISGTPHARNSVQVLGEFTAWRFAPDSRSLLTVDRMGIVARWHGVDFKTSQRLLDLRPEAGVKRFSTSARWLAVGSARGIVQVWDLENGTLSREFSVPWKEATPEEFLADESRLVIRDSRDALHEWDLRSGREIRSWNGAPPQGAVAFTNDGSKCLMVRTDQSTSQLRNLTSGGSFELNLDVGSIVTAAAFSPSGQFYAASSVLGYAILGETTELKKPPLRLNPFVWNCTTLAFSPDSRRLAIGTANNFDGIKIWDTSIGRELFALKNFEGPGGRMRQVAFSANGDVIGCLRAGTDTPRLDLWRAPSLAEIDQATAKTGQSSRARTNE